MVESISQGLPSLSINKDGVKLYKLNDISFSNLKKAGFNCDKSSKEPDQIVAFNGQILIGIEDKYSSSQMKEAIQQLKNNYLPALKNTKYFIARAGDKVKIFYRTSEQDMTEIETLKKGKHIACFGTKLIEGNNNQIKRNLDLLSQQILKQKIPNNNTLEIEPPQEYHNPLNIMQDTIFSLWQKIFVTTGENASKCLSTFVELLLYKGISDANMLSHDYSISYLKLDSTNNALKTYKGTVREIIKTELFPAIRNQPSVINGFAFEEQETTFKSVLKDLDSIGNLADNQLDPDFKRRVLEAFLGSAHGEGTIRSGKHLTPRIIVQAIWEMADVSKNKTICDPACGVGGFILEGLNYPYEFDPLKYKLIGIDRDEQMIITAKANMVLHILDKFASPKYNNHDLAQKVNNAFYHAKNNGTGTLGEIDNNTMLSKYKADYIFANVPFYVNGVKEIDKSLEDLGLSSFYDKCGMGVESRFLKYITSQIQQGNPGLAFVIVTDGILYRKNDNIRKVLNNSVDMLGIVSLPVGVFQNNDWKTSILIFRKKSKQKEHSPIFLYNVENIGVSLDSFRTPIENNDIPDLKSSWQERLSGNIDNTNCKLIDRKIFLSTENWYELFEWCRIKERDTINVTEYLDKAKQLNEEISSILSKITTDSNTISNIKNFSEIFLGDEKYFLTGSETKSKQYTIKQAKYLSGQYPIYSSSTTGPVEYMFDKNNPPILKSNEFLINYNKIISWNIKGDPCEDIRVHDKPFYVTENRGLISIINNDVLDFDYVLFYLRENLKLDGKFTRLNEAHVKKVKEISIKVPINENDEIDLHLQKEIAKTYKKIHDTKNKLNLKLQELQSLTTKLELI